MAEGERHAHVDHVGDGEEGLLAGRLVQEGVRRRLERQDRLAVDRAADPGHEPLGVGEEEVGELRLVGAAAAVADRLDHRLESVRLVQRDHVLRQRDHPDRQPTSSPLSPRGSPCPSQRS